MYFDVDVVHRLHCTKTETTGPDVVPMVLDDGGDTVYCTQNSAPVVVKAPVPDAPAP